MLSPKDTYPGQIDTSDPDYPYGKAQGVTVPGDGTGTPLEKRWVSENFGWKQAVVVAAGVTPNGLPESAANSQILQSLQTIFLDAKNGGTYAPTTEIDIAGKGLKVGDFEARAEFIYDGAVLQGAASVDTLDYELFDNAAITYVRADGAASAGPHVIYDGNNALEVEFRNGAKLSFAADPSNILAMSGLMAVDGEVEIENGGALNVELGGLAHLEAGATLSADAGATVSLAAAVSMTGVVTLGHNVNYTSATARTCIFSNYDVTFNADASIDVRCVMAFTGAGHPRYRRITGADADTTYGINNADLVYVPSGVLTADRIYTLSTTGAGDGDRITFVNRDSSNQITVSSFPMKNASGFRTEVTFVFDGSSWLIEREVFKP